MEATVHNDHVSTCTETLLEQIRDNFDDAITSLARPTALVHLVEGTLTAEETLHYAAVMLELGNDHVALALVEEALLAGAMRAMGAQVAPGHQGEQR